MHARLYAWYACAPGLPSIHFILDSHAYHVMLSFSFQFISYVFHSIIYILICIIIMLSFISILSNRFISVNVVAGCDVHVLRSGLSCWAYSNAMRESDVSRQCALLIVYALFSVMYCVHEWCFTCCFYLICSYLQCTRLYTVYSPQLSAFLALSLVVYPLKLRMHAFFYFSQYIMLQLHVRLFYLLAMP